jgi:hypothetical protein
MTIRRQDCSYFRDGNAELAPREDPCAEGIYITGFTASSNSVIAEDKDPAVIEFAVGHRRLAEIAS